MNALIDLGAGFVAAAVLLGLMVGVPKAYWSHRRATSRSRAGTLAPILTPITAPSEPARIDRELVGSARRPSTRTTVEV